MILVRHLRESLEVLHPVDGGTHDNLQYHAVVRHSALLVFLRIMFSPIAFDPERLYVVAKVSRHERIEAHGKRAAIAVAFWPAIYVSYLGVRV